MSEHELPLLPLPDGLLAGKLIRRVKRFSIEFKAGGERLWAHTNNSGSMLGLLRPGLPLILSPAPAAGRKLPYTLELIRLEKSWVGVNTLTPNRLLRAAFEQKRLPWASGYTHFQPEAKRGLSRLDALLSGPGLPPLWVECKNVTLVEDGAAAFPDAVSERAHKHMREMMEIVRGGERAALFFCIQRNDAACFAPADYVDPAYAELFRRARTSGVEAYPHEVRILPPLPQLAGETGGMSGGFDLGPLLPLGQGYL